MASPRFSRQTAALLLCKLRKPYRLRQGCAALGEPGKAPHLAFALVLCSPLAPDDSVPVLEWIPRPPLCIRPPRPATMCRTVFTCEALLRGRNHRLRSKMHWLPLQGAGNPAVEPI